MDEKMTLDSLMGMLGGGAAPKLQPKNIRLEMGEEAWQKMLGALDAKEFYTVETLSILDIGKDTAVVAYPLSTMNQKGGMEYDMEKGYIALTLEKNIGEVVTSIFNFKAKSADPKSPLSIPVELSIFGEKMTYDMSASVPVMNMGMMQMQMSPSIPYSAFNAYLQDKTKKKANDAAEKILEKLERSAEFDSDEKLIIQEAAKNLKSGKSSLVTKYSQAVQKEFTDSGKEMKDTGICAEISAEEMKDPQKLKERMESFKKMKKKLEDFVSLNPSGRIIISADSPELDSIDESIRTYAETNATKLKADLEQHMLKYDNTGAYIVQESGVSLILKHGMSKYHKVEIMSLPHSSDNKINNVLHLKVEPRDMMDSKVKMFQQYAQKVAGTDQETLQKLAVKAQAYIKPYTVKVELSSTDSDVVSSELKMKIDEAMGAIMANETAIDADIKEFETALFNK